MKAWEQMGGPASPQGSRLAAICRDHRGPVTVLAARGSRSSVILDLEGDGDLDIVTNEFNDRPQVLVSDLAARGGIQWVAVELVGRRSNRDGLGARVTVVTGDRRSTEQHDGKSGYLSQSRLPLYFGLGTAERIDRIEVAWPSGAHQVVEQPPTRRLVRIEEPPAEPPGSDAE